MPNEMSNWRAYARQLLDELLVKAKQEGWTLVQLRKAIFDRYPYGERAYYPYKIWLQEAKLAREAFAEGICIDAMYNRKHGRPTGKTKPPDGPLEGQISLLELLSNGE